MDKLENILDKKLFTIVEDVSMRTLIPLESLIDSKCVHDFGFNQVNCNKKCFECWTTEIAELENSIGGNQ